MEGLLGVCSGGSREVEAGPGCCDMLGAERGCGAG